MPKARQLLIAAWCCATVAVGGGWALFQLAPLGTRVSAAANEFLGTLSAEQRQAAQFADWSAPERRQWHFIPKERRKGVPLRDMTADQRQAARRLLASVLSEVGYRKARQIMELEKILHSLETSAGKNRFPRDELRYYFTVFGQPGAGRWGLSIEGHHLSLNFVLEGERVVAATPAVFAANPATVRNAVTGALPKGTRVLAKEEQLAFDLLTSLNDQQRAVAVIAAEAPADIRAAGEPQPPPGPAAGVGYAALQPEQQALLRLLVDAYLENLPAELQQQRRDELQAAEWDSLHFAWAGAVQPGVGHYYRVQGPTLLIEFVNTQPDAAGNPANHIHSVWRDPRGDFAISISPP